MTSRDCHWFYLTSLANESNPLPCLLISQQRIGTLSLQEDLHGYLPYYDHIYVQLPNYVKLSQHLTKLCLSIEATQATPHFVTCKFYAWQQPQQALTSRTSATAEKQRVNCACLSRLARPNWSCNAQNTAKSKIYTPLYYTLVVSTISAKKASEIRRRWSFLKFLALAVWVYLNSNLWSGLQKTHLFHNR